jgi:hypothetical protein
VYLTQVPRLTHLSVPCRWSAERPKSGCLGVVFNDYPRQKEVRYATPSNHHPEILPSQAQRSGQGQVERPDDLPRQVRLA